MAFEVVCARRGCIYLIKNTEKKNKLYVIFFPVLGYDKIKTIKINYLK